MRKIAAQRWQDPATPYVIGVDESGTGAFAGPFTVCAFMSRSIDTALIRELGAADSKALTAARRRQLCEDLAHVAVIADIKVVPGHYEGGGQRAAWVEAVIKAVCHCLTAIPHPKLATVLIDGNETPQIRLMLSRGMGVNPLFFRKGDTFIPQISAASIYAKTVRSALMAEAHERFPEYGWAANDGYGTADHRTAIAKYGVCELHRRVRPLIPYFERWEGVD